MSTTPCASFASEQDLSLSSSFEQLSLGDAPIQAPCEKAHPKKGAWRVMSEKIQQAGGISELSDDDLETFRKEGRSLRHLNLGKLPIEEEDMEEIEEQCPHLRSLTCGTIDDDTFKVVTKITSLRRLTLYDCSNLTSDDFAGIRNLTELKFLRLMKCTQIRSGLTHLKTLQSLKHIELDEVSVRAFVRSTQDFLELPKLQTYRIGKGRVIDLYNPRFAHVPKMINQVIFWIQALMLNSAPPIRIKINIPSRKTHRLLPIFLF